MSVKVHLRAARSGDAPAIAKVHVATWRATYAGIIPDSYLVKMTESGQTRQWHRIVGRGTDMVLLAVADDIPGGRIVGFGSCGQQRGAANLGEIYTLYVDLDWQGQGIGRRLLHGLLGKLKAVGLNGAMLWVLSENPARFFYEALGGQRVAERQELFAGVKLDEAAYAWSDLESWLAERSRD